MRKRNSKRAKRAAKRFYPGGKLSDYRFEKLIRAFAEGLSATETAALTKISLRTVNHWFVVFRKLVYIEVWENPRSFGGAALRLRSEAGADKMEELRYPGDPFAEWQRTGSADAVLHYFDMRTHMMEQIGSEWDERKASRGIGGDDVETHLHQIELYAKWSSRSLDRPEYNDVILDFQRRYDPSMSESKLYALAQEFEKTLGRMLLVNPSSLPFYWEVRRVVRDYFKREASAPV